MIDISPVLQTHRGLPAPSRRRTSRTTTTATQANAAALSFYLNLQANSPCLTGSPTAQLDSQQGDLQRQPLQQSPAHTGANLGLFNYVNFTTSPPTQQAGITAGFQQESQLETPWPAAWLTGLDGAAASMNQVAPQHTDVNSVSSMQSPFPSHVSSPELAMSWEEIPSTHHGNLNSDTDDLSMLEAQLGIGSYGSFEYVTSPNPLASSVSDGYVIPSANTSLYGSPRSRHHLTNDVQLPGEYFQNAHTGNAFISSPTSASSPLYPDMFAFENENLSSPSAWIGEDNNVWPSAHTSSPTLNSEISDSSSFFPWNSLDTLGSPIHRNTSSAPVTFEAGRALPSYYTFQTQDNISLPSNTAVVENSNPLITRPIWDEKDKQGRRDSQDQILRSRSGSPWQNIAESHSHIFSVRSGIEKSRPQRGRMRPLTIKGKKEALEVRNAGACWACHLSKVKCSPCTNGNPCEQCARLMGKRRFCHLPCFNDPIESLHPFLLPHYLMSHFTAANVENFMNENMFGWGTETLSVRMNWGSSKPLVVNVQSLVLHDDLSELTVHHTTVSAGDSTVLVKMSSPPLGIRMAVMDQMETEYFDYVQDVVRTDLDQYICTIYEDHTSKLPWRLLGAICNYYQAGLDVGDESELIRSALEIHVTCSILERSLILDQQSISIVSRLLGQEYPPRSAARCAQRQMKLAFFMAQQKRILDVLQKWGSLMWATTGSKTDSTLNGHKWVTSFCVFVVLILVMDKTFIAARLFCESNIQHWGHDPVTNRTEVRNLVRLAQAQFFERCKEVFHSRFKTRKAGKESCNPIRDGWRGRAMEMREEQLVNELQLTVSEYGQEIRDHRALSSPDPFPEIDLSLKVGYNNGGRLAAIFLSEFINY